MKRLLIQLLILTFVNTASAQMTNKAVMYVGQEAEVTIMEDFNNTIIGEFWNNGSVMAYNNWHNDGVVDFSLNNINNGVTSFVGSVTQTISGTNFNYFYDAVFDNALAFQLEGDISITNNSDFELGIVDNKISGGLFVFEQDSYHSSTNNYSHINGAVIKVGDHSFDFPIGNGTYFRGASISSPTTSSDTLIGEYFFENTNDQYPVNNLGPNIELVDNTEYWVVEQTAGASQVFLTLSWSNTTTQNEIIANDQEAIHIVRWDETAQQWMDQGGIVDVSSQTVSALVENYGVFTLARVEVENEETIGINFPHFFTPNGDGYHDTWNVIKSKNFEIIKLQIFDRYGKLLKSLAPESEGWDGTYSGKKLVGTDYWFVVDYKDIINNTVKQHRSHFAIKY